MHALCGLTSVIIWCDVVFMVKTKIWWGPLIQKHVWSAMRSEIYPFFSKTIYILSSIPSRVSITIRYVIPYSSQIYKCIKSPRRIRNLNLRWWMLWFHPPQQMLVLLESSFLFFRLQLTFSICVMNRCLSIVFI